MTILVSGKHMEVGETLTQHCVKAVEDLITRYMGSALEASVTYAKDHHLFKVDVQVHISHHFVVNCHGEDEDPYKAIAHALEKLEAKIRKYKNRLKSKKRGIEKPDFVQASKFLIAPQEEDNEGDTPLTIAELDTPIEALSVSEAVMRLEIGNYPVVVFKNAAQNRINVVYKRPDGHIGWIDPR